MSEPTSAVNSQTHLSDLHQLIDDQQPGRVGQSLENLRARFIPGEGLGIHRPQYITIWQNRQMDNWPCRLLAWRSMNRRRDASTEKSLDNFSISLIIEVWKRRRYWTSTTLTGSTTICHAWLARYAFEICFGTLHPTACIAGWKS